MSRIIFLLSLSTTLLFNISAYAEIDKMVFTECSSPLVYHTMLESVFNAKVTIIDIEKVFNRCEEYGSLRKVCSKFKYKICPFIGEEIDIMHGENKYVLHMNAIFGKNFIDEKLYKTYSSEVEVPGAKGCIADVVETAKYRVLTKNLGDIVSEKSNGLVNLYYDDHLTLSEDQKSNFLKENIFQQAQWMFSANILGQISRCEDKAKGIHKKNVKPEVCKVLRKILKNPPKTIKFCREPIKANASK